VEGEAEHPPPPPNKHFCSSGAQMNAKGFLTSNSLSLSSTLTIPKLPEPKCRRFRFRLFSPEPYRPEILRISTTAELRNVSVVILRRRENVGKVWAGVKPKSLAQLFKFKGVFDDAVLEDEVVAPWWEEFPKRWVIVILCFSAFLLCNMDRVSFLLIYISLFKKKEDFVVICLVI